MEEVGEVMDNKFMGLNITPRFAEALGMAQEKEGKGVVTPKVEEPAPEPPSPLVEAITPVQELEEKVMQQVKELDNTGYNMLPGAAGKRDSDPQPSVLEKIMKKSPGLFKSNPSMLQKYESYLRNIKKMNEEEVDKIMFPLWNNYLNDTDPQPKDDKWDRIPEQRGGKKTSEVDTLLPTLEKLTAMIETMNKPKTVLRDKDGKIIGVA